MPGITDEQMLVEPPDLVDPPEFADVAYFPAINGRPLTVCPLLYESRTRNQHTIVVNLAKSQ